VSNLEYDNTAKNKSQNAGGSAAYAHNNNRLIILILCVWITPWLIMAVSYVVSPGYLVGLFVTDLGKIFAAVTFVWETAACFLMFLFKKHMVLRVLFGMVAVAPVFLLIMLGPAILTILQALGPVVR
jgi:hypothetical protein